MNIDYTLWPNTDGNLGNIKVQIPDGVNTFWPEGDALVRNFVYKDGKLAGFVDTKALIANESKSTTFPYDYVDIQVDKSLEDTMTFNKGERTKYLTISYTTGGNGGDETFDFVIIDFNTTDAETINTVRTAKRVVDNKLYDADGGLIGTLDTSKIEVGGDFENEDGLFCNIEAGGETERGLILSEFNSDLSSLRDGSGMFSGCVNLTSFSGDLSSLTNGNAMFGMCSLTSFSSDLSSLTNGEGMFMACFYLTTFDVDLPSLTNGESMFFYCNNLTSFNSDLPSLTDGDSMFENCIGLTSFNVDLPNLTNGSGMFYKCTKLKSITSDLSSLVNGDGMFDGCIGLTSFNVDLPNLTRGVNMFCDCNNLTSFNGDLSSLTNGPWMFKYCKLDTASVQHIADTIKNVSSLTNGSSSLDEVFKDIDIGIGNSTPNEQEKAAFNTMVSKGWTVCVDVNGGSSTQWNPTSLIPIDGEETVTPIPFWAKPVQSDEEHAHYVDAEGNFYNILGGNYIYGDDISTYGMFTCEEDAAANMRLTKIEKPSIFTFFKKS